MAPIEPLILQIIRVCAAVSGIEAPLIAAIIDVESGFDILAVGDENEEGEPQSFGLMQLHIKGAGHGYDTTLLFNPAFNILIGCRYLSYCKSVFPNNVKLMISAYNQGPGGAAERGYGYNKTYVNNVLNLRRKYAKEMDK